MRSVSIAALAATIAFGLGVGTSAYAKDPPGVNPTHFQCYRVEAKAFKKGVVLADQFAKAKVAVGRALILCTPVAKDGEDVKDKTTHLLCYEDKGMPTPKKKAMVINQFGEQVVAVMTPTMLCVPSLKKV